MAGTFPTWVELFKDPSSVDSEAKVLRNDFGDGYSDRAAYGINNIKETASLMTAVLTAEQANTVLEFLSTRAGHESFDWTPLGESVAKKWTCARWTKTGMKDMPNHFQISMVFTREYDL